MSENAVTLKIGGQIYRVVATAGEEELRRYAAAVQERLVAVTGSTVPQHPQALLLAALALAHDLEVERAKRVEVEAKARTAIESWVEKVETVLGGLDDEGKALTR